MIERSLLMCSPIHYKVAHKINHQTDLVRQAYPELVVDQWNALRSTIESFGGKVEVMKGALGWPDLVYTANAGLVIGDKKIILSMFKFPVRQGEAKYNYEWFEGNGWEINQPSHVFEGAGESFFWKDKLLLGFGSGGYFRSDNETKKVLRKYIPDIEIQDLQLVNDKFYHLDLAFTPIPSKNLIAYYPGAFSDRAKKKIQSLNADLIEVGRDDAELFACNAIPLGDSIVMNKKATKLAAEYQKRGLNPVLLDTSEFEKMGGSTRCLTLDLHYAGPK